MEPSSCIEKTFCELQRSCGSHSWHHVFQLAKLLHHHQYGIVALWLQQIHDEVRYTMPWPWWDRKLLQDGNLRLARSLVRLALNKNLHKMAYLLFHARLVVSPWHCRYGSFLSSMGYKKTSMFSFKTNSHNLHCGTYTWLYLYLSNPSTNLIFLSTLKPRSSPRSLCTSMLLIYSSFILH